MKNFVASSSRSGNQKPQAKRRRPLSVVSTTSKTSKVTSDDSKKHFDPNQLKQALVSGRRSVQGVRNLGKSWFEILDNESNRSFNELTIEPSKSGAKKKQNISRMRTLSDSESSCIEELDYDTSKFFEVEPHNPAEEKAMTDEPSYALKPNTKRTTFSANLSRRHFVRASTAKSRIQQTSETIANSNVSTNGYNNYVDEESFLSEGDDETFYEDANHHVPDLEESVNMTSLYQSGRDPEVASVVRRPKSEQLFRPFTPSFHINHNYNRSNSQVLGRKDSNNKRASVEERNETIYKQLCVLLWIFNNLSVDPHHKYTPIATCFSHVCPGGQKVAKAKLAKTKAEELRWQSEIVAKKAPTAEKKLDNEDTMKSIMAPFSMRRSQQAPSSAASQPSVVSTVPLAPKVVSYRIGDVLDASGTGRHNVTSADDATAITAILEQVQEESFASESEYSRTESRSTSTSVRSNDESRSEHSDDTFRQSEPTEVVDQVLEQLVATEDNQSMTLQNDKNDEIEKDDLSTSRVQTPSNENKSVQDDNEETNDGENQDQYGQPELKPGTAGSVSVEKLALNLETPNFSEEKTGNEEIDNTEAGTLTEIVSIDDSDILSQSSTRKMPKKRPPVNRKLRKFCKEDDTLKLPSGMIADAASKVPERMKAEWQQIKLECGLHLRDILAQHKRVQREVSISKLGEIGITLGGKQSTSVEFNEAMRRVRNAAQLVYEKDANTRALYVDWYQTLINNLPDAFLQATQTQTNSRCNSASSSASSFFNDVIDHDDSSSSQPANRKQPLSHYVKLLVGLEQFGRVGAIPSAQITGAALKKFLLREAKLRSWELCDPNVRPAIDFFCEHVAKMNKTEFFDWLVAYCPRVAAIETMSVAEAKKQIQAFW